MISIVIGITRPLGNESRYAIFGGFGLCIIILMHAMTSTARSLASPGLLLIPIIAGLIAWQDWQVGTQFSQVYANRTAMLHRDVRLGLPINAIGERHVIFPIAIYQQNFELLYSSGHKSLRGAGQARPLRAVPIALPPDARLPAYDGNGPAPAFELTLPMPMQMEMLRLEFDSPDARYREIYQLELPNNPDDSAGIASLWVVTGRRTMLFRVEGVLDRIIIRPVERTPGQKLLKCEAILFN